MVGAGVSAKRENDGQGRGRTARTRRNAQARPMNPPVESRPLTIDDAHTDEEFASWLRVTIQWLRCHPNLPGQIRESKRMRRWIPREYINKRLRLQAR